jgi:hypothetical protein
VEEELISLIPALLTIRQRNGGSADLPLAVHTLLQGERTHLEDTPVMDRPNKNQQRACAT